MAKFKGLRLKARSRNSRIKFKNRARKRRARLKRGLRNIGDTFVYGLISNILGGNDNPESIADNSQNSVANDIRGINEELNNNESNDFELSMPTDTSMLDDKLANEKLNEELNKFNTTISESIDDAMDSIGESDRLNNNNNFIDYSISNNHLLRSLLKLLRDQSIHMIGYDNAMRKVADFRIKNELDRLQTIEDSKREYLNEKDEINYGDGKVSLGTMIADAIANAKTSGLLGTLGAMVTLLGLGLGRGSSDSEGTSKSGGSKGSGSTLSFTPQRITSDDKIQFMRDQYNAYKNAGVSNEVALVLAGQDAMESAYGTHTCGAGNFNYGGIKGPHNSNESNYLWTTEYEKRPDGTKRKVRKKDWFRKFNSRDEYVQYKLSNSALGNKRYNDAIHASNAEEAIRRIAEGGYATDPNYAQKLADMYMKAKGAVESNRVPIVDIVGETSSTTQNNNQMSYWTNPAVISSNQPNIQVPYRLGDGPEGSDDMEVTSKTESVTKSTKQYKYNPSKPKTEVKKEVVDAPISSSMSYNTTVNNKNINNTIVIDDSLSPNNQR